MKNHLFKVNCFLINSYVGWNNNMSWPNHSFPSNNLLIDQVQKKSQILDADYQIFTTPPFGCQLEVSSERP